MTRVAFHYPIADDEYWTDEAIVGLVGQIVDVTVLDVPYVRAEITAAARRDDEVLGKGLWVEIEMPRP